MFRGWSKDAGMQIVSTLSISQIFKIQKLNQIIPIYEIHCTVFCLDKVVNPRRCTYKRYQSTLTAAGNPKITTHPSIVGRTGEEWEGNSCF